MLIVQRRRAGAYDPDAQAYITAVEAADTQALEVGVKDAINAFVVGCKADGIWAAIKASCILAGARTLTGALVPLVGTAPTNVGGLFVSGDYNRKTGLVGDGSTKCLDTNTLPSSLYSQNNAHASVYSTSAPATASAYIGVAVGGGSRSIIQSNNLAAITSAAEANTIVTTSGTGLHGISRNTSTTAAFRSSGNSATLTLASNGVPSVSHAIFARKTGGGIDSRTNARLAFYSIGESLDLALLDARVTTLINAIAAAIP
jgi:hypothetical protein